MQVLCGAAARKHTVAAATGLHAVLGWPALLWHHTQHAAAGRASFPCHCAPLLMLMPSHQLLRLIHVSSLHLTLGFLALRGKITRLLLKDFSLLTLSCGANVTIVSSA